MRLFFAVFMPDNIKEALAGLTQPRPGWRLTPPEQFHVTLRFLGQVEEQDLAKWQNLGRKAAGNVPAFFSYLNGTGHFPPRGPARIWQIGVQGEGWQALYQELYRDHEQAQPEREFYPHVTLARSQGGEPWPAASLNAGFWVESLALVESHLSSNGSSYQLIESFPLQRQNDG